MKNTQSTNLVSIIIPVYNRLDALRNTLASVIKQSHDNLEILVVDDGSDIDIYPIIQEFDDKRISYHKLEHKNANVARNFGIEKSEGKYIAMLDSDDLWLENHIADCLNILSQTDADGLYGSLMLQDKQGGRRTVSVRERKLDETMVDYLLSTGYGAQTSTLFMTAESAKGIQWDAHLKRHQDYDFVVRYSKKYQLTPKIEPTTIYVLGTSSPRIDFKSCIRFIKANKDDIEPTLYNGYNSNMLMMAMRLNESSDIIQHYQKEATRYKEFISFQRYISVMDMQDTFIDKWKCRFKYIFHILRVDL